MSVDEAAYASMYPNSPSAGWKPKVELSSDPRRRQAQLQFPATPAAWPTERRHDDEYKKLEALLASTAAMYPRSVLTLCAPEIASAIESVNADIRLIDAMAAE